MAQHSLTLIILAGGLGSRFGGNKQIAEIPSLGRTIMELSIADAVKVGVSQVVIIINQKIRAELEATILPRLPNGLDVVLVEQSIDALPDKFGHLAAERIKPWGTGHALLCAKPYVDNPAIVITADDYYGDTSFEIVAEHFKHSMQWAMVGYPISQTLSDEGGVNRGLCEVNEQQQLTNVIEYLNIKHENTALYGDTPQGERVVIADDSLGSMSFWGITPDVFNYLESGFFEFLESNDNGVTKEYYLPDQIQAAIQGKHQSVTVYTALSPWYGVTYKSELEKVSNKLYELYHGRSNSHRPSAIKNEE
ncbi:NTP transferase domain-containing protein [Pseudoalteromonas sp. CF6-2]|uniref:nucleotidyltransferase family protein n=1 Tax=unclassified Pseudoalteromonas TaxID=194690 RepID=UPI001F333824|nr:NTP transferase domain-containing protein [Pseudoalteromonas sp. CF6-2]|tara:strand:- start:1288 stop:2208 length:921 start_codon:yes stop_codon:yes gene_type:complete